MSPSPCKGFIEGSIFIIKVGSFDRGFYLSQQLLKELIYIVKDKFAIMGFSSYLKHTLNIITEAHN